MRDYLKAEGIAEPDRERHRRDLREYPAQAGGLGHHEDAALAGMAAGACQEGDEVMPDRHINLALQLSTGRPLCVLLQAPLGGNSTAASGLFDGRHWVVAQPPAADITFVAGSVEQWLAYSRALDGGVNPLAGMKGD